MGLFQKKSDAGTGAAVQLREGGRHPFGLLDGYVPLGCGETALYRSIREAVPIVDAALRKLVRLAGGVTVTCREGGAQEGLDWFLQHVDTGMFLAANESSVYPDENGGGYEVAATEGGNDEWIVCGGFFVDESE